MRPLIAVLALDDGLLALDDDGYLWIGELDTATDFDQAIQAFRPSWTPVEGPSDGQPFIDRRSWLDRLEERLRRDAEARDAVRQRLDGLPPIEAPAASEGVPDDDSRT